MARYFTEEHEWIDVDGEIATIGITDYAQEQLGDVVFIELPQIGSSVTKGKEAAVVESVKAASDVFSPVSGPVKEANAALEADPGLVNSAAESGGWFFKVTIANNSELEGLMDEAGYRDFVAGLD